MVFKKKGLNVSFYLLTPTAKQTMVYASISEKNNSATERLRFSTGESFLSQYCNKRFEKKKNGKGEKTVIKNGKDILKRNTTFYLEYQSTLNKIEETLHLIYNEFQKKEVFTLTEIRNEYYKRAGLLVEEKVNLQSAFIEYMQFNKSQWSKATETKVQSTLNHLLKFEEKYGQINLQTLEVSTYNKLRDEYFVNDLKFSNSTSNKYLSYFQIFLKFGKKKGYVNNALDFDELNYNEEIESYKIALKLNEVETLINLDLTNDDRLDKVRDLFLLEIFTGQRFSDAAKVLGNYNLTEKGVSVTQKKTNSRISIPLHPKLAKHREKILTKYPEGLPIISNQKFNDYVKEVGEKSGFKQEHHWITLSGKTKIEHTGYRYNLISSHTGRRTFCTLALKQGISAEEIMKISGHKKYDDFRNYIKVDDNDLNESFENFLTDDKNKKNK